MEPSHAVRVAVVVGDLLTRRGIVSVLGQSGHLLVVGQASDLVTGRSLLRKTVPDVLIVGTSLPPRHETAASVLLEQARASAIRTVVLADDGDADLPACLLADDAGGWGWLVRNDLAEPSRLCATVERVHGGGTVIDDAVMEQIVSDRRRRLR